MKSTNLKDRARELFDKLAREARDSGYFLNPDITFTMSLMEGLVINNERYGYLSCPCRLSSGKREHDLDIICPCDYRDPDLDEYGTCYCALYVSEEISKKKKEPEPIPERRPHREKPSSLKKKNTGGESGLSFPVWRCKVCGYLCARDNPPGKCPVCKADRDRFERFL